MRSKIEANEYKDYILGFIFYKYVSDKLVRFCKSEDFSDDDLRTLSEDDKEAVQHIQSNIGYFIAYDHLFSTWLDQGNDFDVSQVRDALSAFKADKAKPAKPATTSKPSGRRTAALFGRPSAQR